MILVDCVQGTPAWIRARLGIPTASGFSKILTAGGKPSKQADAYMRDLLAEFFIGEPARADASQFMERGTMLEKAARKWYVYERGVEVQEVGLCLRDDRMAGASPDGLVGADGLLELKVPSAATHIEYLLGGLEGEYWSQVQGQLYITGRPWCDLVAYNPALPPVVVHVQRDEEYIATLSQAVDEFVERLLAGRARLIELGCVPAEKVGMPASAFSDLEPF